jgi:competence protein ComEC
MRVEREIAVFAFPFAAGVIAAVILGASPCIIKPTYPTMALTVTFLSAGLLMSASSRKCGRLFQWSLVTLCAIACGAFIGMCGIEMEISAIESEGVLTGWARAAGQKIQGVIDRIPFENSTTNGVIKALLTGNRSGLSTEVIQAFRDSGASHILALSGLHLGIIYGILHYLTKPLGKSRKAEHIRSISIMLSCGFYTLATGTGPSVTRAFLFILIGETARLNNRYRDIRSTLMAALIIQIALNPSDIRSAGFQLSYMAIAGIAYIYPWMKNLWPEGKDFPILRKIWNSICMSVSCQITTGPIAWIYFHSFPTHFLLTNLIAIPLTGIIIPLSLLTLALSSTGICPDILINTTEALIMAMTRALETISLM